MEQQAWGTEEEVVQRGLRRLCRGVRVVRGSACVCQRLGPVETTRRLDRLRGKARGQRQPRRVRAAGGGGRSRGQLWSVLDPWGCRWCRLALCCVVVLVPSRQRESWGIKGTASWVLSVRVASQEADGAEVGGGLRGGGGMSRSMQWVRAVARVLLALVQAETCEGAPPPALEVSG